MATNGPMTTMSGTVGLRMPQCDRYIIQDIIIIENAFNLIQEFLARCSWNMLCLKTVPTSPKAHNMVFYPLACQNFVGLSHGTGASGVDLDLCCSSLAIDVGQNQYIYILQ